MDVIDSLPNYRKLAVAWAAAASILVVLGVFRASTNAEFALASAAIIPVLLVAWAGGFGHGAVVSTLATAMLLASDFTPEREISAPWLPILNGVTRLATYLLVAYLTSMVRTLLLREVQSAKHDALTGLLNRRAFVEAGDAEIRRARRYHHPLAVLFLDLDNFKQLNDGRGHDVGDAALRAVAARLKMELRDTDCVARLGGDEFAAMLPEIDQSGATEVGSKIAAGIASALAPFPPVKASIGIAWYELANGDFPEMLKAADMLMYQAKKEDKGGFRVQQFS